jgi:hypothetical protein
MHCQARHADGSHRTTCLKNSLPINHLVGVS